MQGSSATDSCFSRTLNECDSPRSWIREKIRQLEGKMAEIKTAKEKFLEKFSIAEKDIEIVRQKIGMCIQAREHVLKLQLQSVRREMTLEWNRQLEFCLQAEQKLRMMNNEVKTIDEIRGICCQFDESIGFINSATALRFEYDEPVRDEVENLGKLLSTTHPIRPKFMIGDKWDNGDFFQPRGICSDPTGRILVADCGNNKIQVFNEFGELLFHFGKFGSRPGELHHPTGIAVDKKSRIVVSDKQNHRIQVFTYTGGFLMAFGQKGTNPGQFSSPWAVAVNEDCDIAVSDTHNRRIQLFTSHGQFLRQFRFAPNLKVTPMGIAFKPDRSLLVTDFSNSHLLAIDESFMEARVLEGKGLDFWKPVGVACNRQGGFAVADCNRVKVFDENGNPCRLINGDKREVGCSQDVCFVSDGRIAVVGKNTLRIY